MGNKEIIKRQPHLFIIIPAIVFIIIFAVVMLFFVDSEFPSQVTGLTVTDMHDGNLYLNWDNATDNKGVIKYYIYRNNEKLSAEPTTPCYIDTNVSVGSTYNYRVSTVDADNNEGPKSINVTGQPTYGYSEFYILDSNHNTDDFPTNLIVGQNGNIIIGVKCNEHEFTNYTIKIKLTFEDASIENIIEYSSAWNQNFALNPNDVIYRNITLNHNEVFEDSFSFNILQSGTYKFEAFLFNQNTTDSHQVNLWITVA